MRKIIFTLLTLAMLSGCTFSLPPNFVEKAQTDLSTEFLLYQTAWWVTEYPVRGALVCDEETLMFVVLDETLTNYTTIVDLKFKDINNVSVIEADFGRKHLVLQRKSDTYSFWITRKGAPTDKVMTYEFAVFIAGKLNQNTEQFAAELEKEKKEEKEINGSGMK